jgi:hypothetical protein
MSDHQWKPVYVQYFGRNSSQQPEGAAVSRNRKNKDGEPWEGLYAFEASGSSGRHCRHGTCKTVMNACCNRRPVEFQIMPTRPTLATHMLTALCLALPWLAIAQISPSALSAAEERAQREAERVFSVIKFHTIRSKPATEAGTGKPRPPTPPRAPVRAAPAPSSAPAVAATPVAEPAAPATAIAETVTPTSRPPAAVPDNAPAGSIAAPDARTASASPPVPVEQDPEPRDADDADDADEVPLRMQHFVAPVLTPALQATLGAGVRSVRVRLTVQPDGSVSHAEAAAGVPRRLAKPATDAILQWQFAPLPQARTADVDIAFRND